MMPGRRENSGWPPPSDDSGGRSGAGRLFARLFENPDNPLGWSLRVFTAFGITVRLHLTTILFVVFMLLWSIPPGHAGIGFMTLSMGSLLLLVLLHEFGHCFACRWVGGTADRIVMLPFGGLALVRPPDEWKANFITTAGGPMVNVAIVPLTSTALFLAGLGGHIIFNPLNPMGVISDPAFAGSSSIASYARVGLWWLHYINLVLLAFNVLIPAYPLDGGRLMQALLWRKKGYRVATEIAVTIGLLAAMALGVFALVADESMLLVIAVFAGWSCWMERRRLRAPDELGESLGSLGSGISGIPDDEAAQLERAKRESEKQRATEEAEQAELDRILARISEVGMDGLTRAERKALQRATEKKRQAGG
jgi:stage IV sporulation protein FB